MLAFYVDLLGLNPSFYAAVIAVYAVIDALDNPFFGFLSDRTRTRWGRRKPWLLAGAPVLALCLISFFAVPDGLDEVSLGIWFVISVLLMEMTDSMINANYAPLMPELYPHEQTRALANSMRQGFQLVAMVISLALTPTLTTHLLGSEHSTRGYMLTAIIYAVLGGGVILFMALGIHEGSSGVRAPRPPAWQTVKAVLTNHWFWQVGVAGACYGASMALVLNGMQLYVKYSLGLPIASTTILEGIVIVISVLGLFAWTRVVRSFGAGRVWRIAFPVFALGFVPLFFANSLVTGILGSLTLAVGWSGMLATNDLVTARVLDEDTAHTGAHREGTMLAAFGMFGRLNELVIAVCITAIGIWFGYRGGDAPGSDPGMAFRVYVSVFPLALAVCGSIIAWCIRLPRNLTSGVQPAAQAQSTQKHGEPR